MIDFVEQKQKTPVSFKLFETWVEKNYDTTLNIWNGTIRNEDVLLFMDHKNINIQISIKCATDDSRWYLPYIWSDSDGCDMDEHLEEMKDRTHATNQAIKKGFDLLEDKLKKN